MDERLLEIVIARRRGVFDAAFADVINPPRRIFRVGLDVENFVGIQAVFQCGQRDDGFEDGAGRVILIRRAVFFRRQLLHPVPLVLRNALREIVRVKRGRGNHRQHVAVANVHDDNRRPRVCAAIPHE